MVQAKMSRCIHQLVFSLIKLTLLASCPRSNCYSVTTWVKAMLLTSPTWSPRVAADQLRVTPGWSSWDLPPSQVSIHFPRSFMYFCILLLCQTGHSYARKIIISVSIDTILLWKKFLDIFGVQIQNIWYCNMLFISFALLLCQKIQFQSQKIQFYFFFHLDDLYTSFFRG